MPWLVDADFVAFLDDDNEYDPDHLKMLVRHTVNTRAEWAHSLRTIVDQAGQEVCPDNCESLGGICHTVCGPDDRLIDTNCYLIKRDLAVATSPAWNSRFRSGGIEADRLVCRTLLSSAPHAVVRRHSVRYRVGTTAQSVKATFFLEGNRLMGYDFAGKQDVYIFHFSPQATRDVLSSRRKTDRSYALYEWQLTLLRGVDREYNLLDGYANAPNLPPGATVLVTMCQPQEVPWDFLRDRTDLWRMAYCLESPNIRHAAQWDPAALATHFDVCLAYWRPLLDDPRLLTVYCPHNTHHLDFDNPLDLAQMRANRGSGKSCCMVLERRPGLSGTYKVPNMDVRLECLDPLRDLLVRQLDITVYGQGWDSLDPADYPKVRVGHGQHRSKDPRRAVDIYQDHTFVLVVENCDAEWYASEKLYDALLAGAIPLYYGSVPEPLACDLAGLYVDLKQLFGTAPRDQWSALLARHIDSMSDEDVAAYKARIAGERHKVLRSVSTASFAHAVRQAVAMRPV